MIKQTIPYTDFNGIPQVEDFYFNLSAAELTELELTHKGGFKAYLQAAIDSEDGGIIMSTFKEIIGMSVGQRSADGKRFAKSEAIKDDFFSSPAYSVFFMSLVTDADAASKFVNGVVPGDLEAQVNKSEAARARSEAQLQGRLTKKEPEVETVREEVSDTVMVDVDMDRKIQEGVEAALRAQAANGSNTQGYQSQNFQ